MVETNRDNWAGGEQLRWLGLVYSLPSEPSRARVAVWRSLKKLGAINFQQGLWLMPFSATHLSNFQQLAQEICSHRGEATVLKIETTRQEDDLSIERAFQQAREIEYAEVIEGCYDFFAELDKETQRQNFTFAEVEENEEELEKLEKWLGKIKERDFFGAPRGKEAEELLEECRRRLAEFSDKVYACNLGLDRDS